MSDAATTTITLASGTRMPALGFGTWQMTGEEGVEGVRDAIELGYRLIDTSGDYGNEPEVGEAVRTASVDRDEIFLTSKVEPHEDAYASTGERLDRLGVDVLDLCLIHHPPRDGAGEELWRALIDARRDGLVRDIGVSNFGPERIDALVEATGEAPAVNQVEWSPFGHSETVLEHARDRGIVLQAYTPLTRGRRLGDDTLAEIAAAHGRTPAQVALRWTLQLGLAPLPKAASAEHRRENLAVFDFWLDDEQMRRIGALNEHYSPVGGLSYD